MVRSSPFRSICLLLLPFLLSALSAGGEGAGRESRAHRARRGHQQRGDAEPASSGSIRSTCRCGSTAPSPRPRSRHGSAMPGQQNLEGDFTLEMPAGSVVTGYALDIGGQMVDGVLVDQRQARIAYEARVRAADRSRPRRGRPRQYLPHPRLPDLPEPGADDPAALHDAARSAHRLRPAAARDRRDRRLHAGHRSDRHGAGDDAECRRARIGHAGNRRAGRTVSP